MVIAHEKFQVIDGSRGVVHEALSRAEAEKHVRHTYSDAAPLASSSGDHPRALRFLVRHPSRVLTLAPSGVAFRVVAR